MNIFQVPVQFVDKAWRDGAHKLTEAAEKSGGEITGDQLRLILTRGERILLGLGDETGVSGWAAVSIQQLPNLRALYVYALYSPGSTGPEAFSHLSRYALDNGCSCIRGACGEAVGRIWVRKFKAKPVYTIYHIEVNQ